MVGILGLGIQSTLFYTSYLHQKYFEEYGKYHTYPYLQYQIDFDELNQFLPDNFDVLVPRLQKVISQVKTLPPKKWIIPNITLHETFDKLNTQLKIYHPLELAVEYCRVNKVKDIIIFGTYYSMKSKYLIHFFENQNIKVLNIDAEHYALIDSLRKKVYNNSQTKADIENYIKIIGKYKQYHIVIACTELSILTNKINSKKLIDLALLQLNTAYKENLKI